MNQVLKFYHLPLSTKREVLFGLCLLTKREYYGMNEVERGKLAFNRAKDRNQLEQLFKLIDKYSEDE